MSAERLYEPPQADLLKVEVEEGFMVSEPNDGSGSLDKLINYDEEGWN